MTLDRLVELLTEKRAELVAQLRAVERALEALEPGVIVTPPERDAPPSDPETPE